MKVAVTGGAGYIGSTLIKNLVNQGDKVVSVDNQSIGDYTPLRKAYGDRVKLVEGDIRDLSLLEEACKDCDSIAHLAALPGLVRCRDQPEEAVSVNIYGTHQVLETARRLDIRKVVFCSSASVYGKPIEMPVTESHPTRPLNLYGVTKLAGEKLMETYYDNYGIETVNLRFGNIYGVGLFTRYDTVIPKFVNQAINDMPLTIYGDGGYSRDFVHAEDITKAIMLSLSKQNIGGETFNVGGDTMTINQIADIVKKKVEELVGKKVEAINTEPRVGETKLFSYNLDKIRRLLDFTNDWNVEKGVNQIIGFRLKNPIS
jgi:UDP-glucose 4-epimerase